MGAHGDKRIAGADLRRTADDLAEDRTTGNRISSSRISVPLEQYDQYKRWTSVDSLSERNSFRTAMMPVSSSRCPYPCLLYHDSSAVSIKREERISEGSGLPNLHITLFKGGTDDRLWPIDGLRAGIAQRFFQWCRILVEP